MFPSWGDLVMIQLRESPLIPQNHTPLLILLSPHPPPTLFFEPSSQVQIVSLKTESSSLIGLPGDPAGP